MNNKNYIIICLAAFGLSVLLFAYHREYIILNFKNNIEQSSTIATAQKQNIILHFWQHNNWHSEQVPVLFSENSVANLQQLVSRWAQLLQEEKITKKKVVLQSATISFDTQELIISFDRVPWNKENSTYEKWMTIEGLLKTIKTVDPAIKRVRFLINQQPLQDTHLDFTNAWPLNGFA